MKQETEVKGSAGLLKALEQYDGSSFLNWFTKYGKQIVIGFLALFLLVFLLSRWTSGSTVKAEEDFLTAEAEFRAFQKNITKGSGATTYKEPLEKLIAILSRHPELHAKYDGPITQTLIAFRTDSTTSQKLGNATLKRTKVNKLPHFTDYAQITLLISQNNYPEALKQTVQLKDKLATSTQTNEEVLSVLNLVRYAILQQQTNDKKAELAAWQDVKSLISKRSPAIKEVLGHFTAGQVNLLNYIEAREKILNT